MTCGAQGLPPFATTRVTIGAARMHAEIRAAGYVDGLKAVGFAARACRDAGYSAAECRRGGFPLRDATRAGFSLAALHAGGYCEVPTDGSSY